MRTELSEEYFLTNGVLPLFDILRYEIFPKESSQKLKGLFVKLAYTSVCDPQILGRLIGYLKTSNWSGIETLIGTGGLKKGGASVLGKLNTNNSNYVSEIFELYFSIEDRATAFHLLAYMVSPAFQTQSADHWSWFMGKITDMTAEARTTFVRGIGPVEIPII